jgi:hypothetical protein
MAPWLTPRLQTACVYYCALRYLIDKSPNSRYLRAHRRSVLSLLFKEASKTLKEGRLEPNYIYTKRSLRC